MLKGRKKELWDKAEDERCRCQLWLLTFMRNGQPKLATKAEHRSREITGAPKVRSMEMIEEL